MYKMIWYYNDDIILYDNTYMWYTPVWTFFPYMNILVWTPHLLAFLASFFVPLLSLQLSLTNVNCFFYQVCSCQVISRSSLQAKMQIHLFRELSQLLPIIVAALTSTPDMLAFLPDWPTVKAQKVDTLNEFFIL